ncbi:putative feruloyl esterase [Diaporthe sp. PMI_573]|nr:putative feruloyl esterase [Diaporthaceae sp. PMI_573]
MSNSSLASLCSSGNIPDPALFGAEILSLTSNLVSNYSTYVPETYNYNHPSVSVENVNYCNITVTYTHPGQNDRINVEAWLPLEWNERLMAVGGGGLVAGRFVLSYFFMAGAIGQGYATVTTDAGTSTDPATGLTELLLKPGNIDWNAVQNFGSRALNDESIIAKGLIESFYGRKPQYSYWSGCSQGGRQGLMLAQRYPTAYDGIVASAPAINIPRFTPSLYWPQLVMNLHGEHPRNCEINALTDAAIAYCDPMDGVADGIISDTDGCDFDPFSVVGESFNCSDTGSVMQISHGAALVANATWAGPMAADGARLWYGLEKGSFLAGAVGNAVGIASTDCSKNGTCVGMAANSGEGWLAYGAAKDPSFDSSKLTLDAYSWLMHDSETEWKSLWSTNEPDLSAYRNAGGKIMTYHGLADPNIPPKGTRDYYESVAKVLPDVNDFFRVFEVPGLEHCSGGTGGQPTTIFDQMRAWVENGTVPETLPISFTDAKNETQNRILCPLPLKTTFNATCADGARAECFYCAEK